MHLSNLARWALAVLLGTALLAGSGVLAIADEEAEHEDEHATSHQKMKVYVTTQDGTKTIKVLRMVDGNWVAVDKDGAQVEHMENVLVPHDVRIVGKDGVVVLSRMAAKGKAAGSSFDKSPLPTMLRWLFEASHKEKDALDAWFAAGDDVPFALLRNMLKEDGWDAARLRSWVHGQVKTHIEAMLREHVQGGAHGRAHGRAHGGAHGGAYGRVLDGGRGAQGCTHCGRTKNCQACGQEPCKGCGECGCKRDNRGQRGSGQCKSGQCKSGQCGSGRCKSGRCNSGHGRRGAMRWGPWGRTWSSGPQTRTHAQSSAYILWHDGQGWQKQEIPGGHGAHFGPWMAPPPGPHGGLPPHHPPVPPSHFVPPRGRTPHGAPSHEGLDLDSLPPGVRGLLHEALKGAIGKHEGAEEGSPRRGHAPLTASLLGEVAEGAAPFLAQMFKDLPAEQRQALMRQMMKLGSQVFEPMDVETEIETTSEKTNCRGCKKQRGTCKGCRKAKATDTDSD